MAILLSMMEPVFAAPIAFVDVGTTIPTGSIAASASAVTTYTDNTITYNAVAPLAASTSGAIAGTYANLVDVANANTGWGVSFVKTGATGGTGPQGIVYSGSSATTSAPFTNTSSFAIQDGMFINNNAIMTITFSGLNPTTQYNLGALAALDTGVGAATASNFSLVTGTSASTTTQVLRANAAGGAAAQWTNVTPDGSGVIAFSASTNGGTSGFRTELNTIRLEAVPEPASLGLMGLMGLGLLARRRTRGRWRTANKTGK